MFLCANLNIMLSYSSWKTNYCSLITTNSPIVCLLIHESVTFDFVLNNSMENNKIIFCYFFTDS